MTGPLPPLFGVAGGEAAELQRRWEALLAQAPRLQPLLVQLLARRRLTLEEHLDRGAADRALLAELERWLREFEELPHFAVSAIGTLLQEEAPQPRPGRDPDALPEPSGSPERALGELETLLSDPAFALAFHCVEARLLPQLEAALAPSLAWVPQDAWLGLLHATAPQGPLLTAAVAVTLVLRVRSGGWARLPAGVRHAALRLFSASAGDLRAGPLLARLCGELPASWRLAPSSAPDFVAAAAHARVSLGDACGLCARVVAATRARSGGLAALEESGAPPASEEELAELGRTARRFARIPGFVRLLDLL